MLKQWDHLQTCAWSRGPSDRSCRKPPWGLRDKGRRLFQDLGEGEQWWRAAWQEPWAWRPGSWVGREEICHHSSILASLNLGSLVLAVGLAAQGTDGSVGQRCTAPPWMSDSCRQPCPQRGQTHPHIPHAPQMSRCDESQNTLPTPRDGPALPWKEH